MDKNEGPGGRGKTVLDGQGPPRTARLKGLGKRRVHDMGLLPRLLIAEVLVFVLVRMLSGFPRALLQQFGIVLGQECGRRLAVDDMNGAVTVVTEGARLYSVLCGVATGLLLGAGFDIALLEAAERQDRQGILIQCRRADDEADALAL